MLLGEGEWVGGLLLNQLWILLNHFLGQSIVIEAQPSQQFTHLFIDINLPD